MKEDVFKEIFFSLGVLNRPIAFHSSFKKIKPLCDTPEEMVQILKSSFPTILLPAFTHYSTVGAPEDDRPPRNGIDYSKEWVSARIPLHAEDKYIDPKMGVLPRKFAEMGGCLRSEHAWHSWLAWGSSAKTYIGDHPWSSTNLPLERLMDDGGWCILAGVGLEACTAIHLAEEKMGRAPFVRWAIDKNGHVDRVRACGCANGFGKLEPFLGSILKTAKYGDLEVKVARLKDLVEESKNVLQKNPELSRCSPTCVKCQDMIAGGPLV